MQLRSNKFREIKGLLRRPQTLRPVFHLDVDVEEYNKQFNKFRLYNSYTFSQYDINKKINFKDPNYFKDLNNFNKNSLDFDKLHLIEVYKKLKASEVYDESICKIGLLTIFPEDYIGFYFPKIMLKEVNSDRNPVELRDMYFYLTSQGGFRGFRTTFDINNPRFTHPHLSQNFSTFCLGQSPLNMSLNNLKYNFDNFDENDADIFWINLYNTVSQKTEHGDHYYGLDKLNQGSYISTEEFEDIVFGSEDLLSNMYKYVDISISSTDIKPVFNINALKTDYFQLFSEDTSVKTDIIEPLEKNVSFNNNRIKNKKLTAIYKGTRVFYSDIDGLLNAFIKKHLNTSFINKIYDDYKEKTKQPDNSGEQSVGQNQVFEFQML